MSGHKLLAPTLCFSFCCQYLQHSHENVSSLNGFKFLPYVKCCTFVHPPFCVAIVMFVPLSLLLKSEKEPWNESQMHLGSIKPQQFARVTFVKRGVQSATLKVLASS